MKNFTILRILLFAFLAIYFVKCGSSTGRRYKESEQNSITESVNNSEPKTYPKDLKEDFDITPYKTKINFEYKEKSVSKTNDEVWFDYGSSENDSERKILAGTADGYRVLVSSTDNMEEANQIKDEVIGNTNRNEIYIDFEPPFYKVKVGDFSDQKSADDIRFKLSQLGYKEAKVIKDKINIFKND